MQYKSLKTRLMLLLLVVGILPVFITVTYNYFATFTSFEEVQFNEQQEIEHSVSRYFEQTAAELQYLAELYAQDPEIRQLLLSQDRTLIEADGEALFMELSARHKLAIVEIGNTEGAVHVRGHNPSTYGDDKAGIAAIQGALNGEIYSGFEYGSSGLAVRAFAPIEANGRIIGTLQIGTGNEFVAEVQKLFPNVALQLLDTEGQIAEASDQSKIGGKLTGDAVTKVLKGEAAQLKNKEAHMIESFLPMKDPTGAAVIGGIHLTQNIEKTENAMAFMMKIGAVILVATFILAIAIAFIYSRTLTKPIVRAAEMAHLLREGDLTQRMEAQNRRDEIGQLMSAMKGMQENLHETIGEVSGASDSVMAKSTLLAQSAAEVSTGAQAIAETMDTLSRGVESQTNEISEVYEAVTEFTDSLKETTEQSTKLEAFSQNVRTLSSEGTAMMHTSNGHMQQIHHMMQAAIEKMDDFGARVSQISSFVKIIEDVAAQTNLLALNASIEAARAGEHGKGFAVVAEEVRKLAEQSAHSVTEITAIVGLVECGTEELGDSLQRGFTTVETGASQLMTTAATFEEIEQSVLQMDQFTKQVLVQIQSMSKEGQVINDAMQEISAITEQTTASVEETTATVFETSTTMNQVADTTAQLAELAEKLNAVVKNYRV